VTTQSTLGIHEELEGNHQPAIDDLLEKVSSKYALVIYSASAPDQNQRLLRPAGRGPARVRRPAGRAGSREKPLSIALREIHGGLLEHTEGE